MFSPLKKTDPDWFVFDWKKVLIKRWEPGEIVPVDALRRSAVPCGFILKCTAGGETGPREPAMPSASGVTVVDRGATWQSVAWAAPNLPTIQSCTYSISPSGITQPQAAIDAALLRTRVRLDAGAAAIGMYTVTATMTDANGEQYVASDTVEVID